MKVWLRLRALREQPSACFHPEVLEVLEVLEGSPQGSRYSFHNSHIALW
jgi:hypothetical protein